MRLESGKVIESCLLVIKKIKDIRDEESLNQVIIKGVQKLVW